MGYREVDRMEIEELVRRWQVNGSQRAIARATGLARETVKKYLAAAGDLGLSATGPPPTERELVELRRLGVVATQPIMRVAPQAATLAAYRDQIATWIDDDHLLLTRVQELLGQQGAPVAYTTPAALRAPGWAVEAAAVDGAHGADGAWRSGRDGLRQAGDAHQPGHWPASGRLGATGGVGLPPLQLLLAVGPADGGSHDRGS